MLPNNQVRERLRPKVVASVALDGAGLADFARKTGQVTQATTHIRTHHVETIGAHCRLQPHDSLRACVRKGGRVGGDSPSSIGAEPIGSEVIGAEPNQTAACIALGMS
eukprot:COSAG01_NODE_3968_length_5483_cov_4.305906_4_plen_108_part_00